MQHEAGSVADLVALEIQNLLKRADVDRERALLRIDYRREVNQAPFHFDMVQGKLHRAGCAAIPKASTEALYAVWEATEEFPLLACDKCRPEPAEANKMSRDTSVDILYGLLSLVDQFASVLKERGREYRDSARGRQLADDLQGMFLALDQTQREALELTATSLDNLVKIVQQANQNLAREIPLNGTGNGNGIGQSSALRPGNHKSGGSRRQGG